MAKKTAKNIFGFGKKKAEAKCAKRSSMTFPAALEAAYSGGRKSGDTGHFKDWLCEKGLDGRSDIVRKKLEAQFKAGVLGVREKAAAEHKEWSDKKDREMAEFMKGSKDRMRESMRKSGEAALKASKSKNSTRKRAGVLKPTKSGKMLIPGKERGSFEWQDVGGNRMVTIGTPVKPSAKSNPIPLLKLKMGKATAVVSPAGIKKYRVTITNGEKKHVSPVLSGFEAARAYARIHLHEVATAKNPLDALTALALTESYGGAAAKAAGKLGQVAGKLGHKGKVAIKQIAGKLKRSRNPISSAEKLHEEFTGFPSEEIIEYVSSEHRHSALAGLGKLIALIVLRTDGKTYIPLIAPGFKYEGASTTELNPRLPVRSAKGHWVFGENTKLQDIVMLCSNEDGDTLYLQGGDQSVDTKALGFRDRDEKDLMLLGTIVRIWYRARKVFEAEGKEQVDFYHDLGKEGSGGECPVLMYKPRDPSLHIIGGRYYIAPAESSLGASPGICG